MKEALVLIEPQALRFIGPEALWSKLDDMARALLGVTAAEFGIAYREGRFADRPIAEDLALLLGHARRPR